MTLKAAIEENRQTVQNRQTTLTVEHDSAPVTRRDSKNRIMNAPVNRRWRVDSPSRSFWRMPATIVH